MRLFPATQTKLISVKIFSYVIKTPLIVLALLALGYLSRLLLRISISTHGAIEDTTINSPQSNACRIRVCRLGAAP